MEGNGIDRVEAIFNAVSKIKLGGERTVHEERCPKCRASDFVDLPDLFMEAAGRLDEHPDQANVVHVGGLTDAQIITAFAPPPKKSALRRALLAAVPLFGGATYAYRRFGELPGEIAFMVAGIITVMVLLTTLRRFSDEYYNLRAQWRRRYLCRRCGHLIET